MTGSSGFMGRHLIPFLQAKGHQVTALTSKDCDLTDSSDLKRIPLKKYDQIFHLAAWTQAGDFCLHHSGEQWIINQQINTNMLAWWQKHAPQAKMVALGTSVSYASEQELMESKYMAGLPSDKFYAYAMSKRMLLAGLQSLNKQYGMKYIYLIPSTLYGPGYHMDGRQLHFIFDLIKKILRGKEYGEPVVLWGDGHQRRELVYVDDFLNAMYTLNEAAENDIYNIGSGEDYSIRDFAKVICELTGYDESNISFNVDAYVGAKSKILDIEKMTGKIGKPSRVPLHEGISKTIEWMKQQPYFMEK